MSFLLLPTTSICIPCSYMAFETLNLCNLKIVFSQSLSVFSRMWQSIAEHSLALSLLSLYIS